MLMGSIVTSSRYIVPCLLSGSVSLWLALGTGETPTLPEGSMKISAEMHKVLPLHCTPYGSEWDLYLPTLRSCALLSRNTLILSAPCSPTDGFAEMAEFTAFLYFGREWQRF